MYIHFVTLTQSSISLLGSPDFHDNCILVPIVDAVKTDCIYQFLPNLLKEYPSVLAVLFRYSQ